MPEPRSRPRKAPQPGWLALNACGDGFWEFDLLSGSAWFSDWFYRKLGWSEARRSMLDLQPLMRPADWDELMRKLRGQLEQAQPLDLELRVRVADGLECWQLRGAAQRNAAGQPIGLAGSVREVGAERAPERTPEPRLLLRCVRCAAGGGGAHRCAQRRSRRQPQVARTSRARGGARHPLPRGVRPDGGVARA